jgi:hypothetical protein
VIPVDEVLPFVVSMSDLMMKVALIDDRRGNDAESRRGGMEVE